MSDAAQNHERTALLAPCAECHGVGTVDVRRGISYEMDTAEERALNWQSETCPACKGWRFPAVAAELERLRAENARMEPIVRSVGKVSRENASLTAERDAAVASEAALRAPLYELRESFVSGDAEREYAAMGAAGEALAAPIKVHLEKLKAEAGRERAVKELRLFAQEYLDGCRTVHENNSALAMLARANEIAKEGK